MFPSISCSELLAAARRGADLPYPLLRQWGAERASDFFRLAVEPLSDSFDPADAAAYLRLMRAWDLAPAAPPPAVPESPSAVYVLSRVTLGADIKIASPVLDAMKRRFPRARVVFVGNRKSAELFAADPRVEHLDAAYPRTGSVDDRIAFAAGIRARIAEPDALVLDPDSRITQLGLVPLCDPSRHFHFPSRTAGFGGSANLTDLVCDWLETTFGLRGSAYLAPEPVPSGHSGRAAAVSLGVGGNDAKCLPGDFEARLLSCLADRFDTLWVDRGAGGDEARRVTEAVAASGTGSRVRYWEGSFAGFASLVSQCDFYTGYDSAGQHAAAAFGVPTVSVFAGSPSERFESRWAPRGPGPVRTVSARGLSTEACLRAVAEGAAIIKI